MEQDKLYDVKWIQKYLGISRYTLLLYEKEGFITKNESYSKDDHRHNYHKYTDDDIHKLWIIKLLIKLGYELKDIRKLVDDPENYNIYDTISEKIDKLEKERRQLDQLIGHAKFIKATGIMPGLPKEMGSITFDEFLEHSHEEWNANSDIGNSLYCALVEYAQSHDVTQITQDELTDIIESVLHKPMEDMTEQEEDEIFQFIKTIHPAQALIIDDLYRRLAQMYDLSPADPSVQSLVKYIYEYNLENLYKDKSILYTPEYYASHEITMFVDSDVAAICQRKYGLEQCKFIAECIEYFGIHANNTENSKITEDDKHE